MFYKGLVEDNNDPEKQGRCRVRILPIHTKIKIEGDDIGIPTNQLPWANPAWPIISSSTSGIGNWNIPLKGTWVWIFFEDEPENQYPVYFATISAVQIQQANISEGFNDPSGKYPLSNRLSEPDVNRLVRGETANTIIAIKQQETIKNIVTSKLVLGNDFSISENEIKFSESSDIYSTIYPHNAVVETDVGDFLSGHVIEMDDTPDKERIHVWHKKGTSILFHWTGDLIEKIVRDGYKFVLGKSYSYINNDNHVVIWGDDNKTVRNNSHVEVFGHDEKYVKGNEIEFISGDKNEWIGADLKTSSTKPTFDNITKRLDGTLNEIESVEEVEIGEIGGSYNQLIENNLKQEVKGNEYKTVDGTIYTEVKGIRNLSSHQVGSTGDYTIVTEGEFQVKADKMIRMKGCRNLIAKGVVTGYSVCPLLLGPHLYSSRTVKNSL